MQEWQYSGGVAVERLFRPQVPDWFIVTGVATSIQPAYSGSRGYRYDAGPAIAIRYRGRAFLSTGSGLGYDIVDRLRFRMSLAVGLDLGRRMYQSWGRLRGLGDIPRAPFFKLAGSYVISKQVPVVLRADIRKIVGGMSGVVGDVDVFSPLPGSSPQFVMFAGPTVTFADERNMQTAYGVNALQAVASGYPVYLAHGGLAAAGFGFGATRFFTPHLLGNLDTSVSRLLGSAARSPITDKKTQDFLALTLAYLW